MKLHQLLFVLILVGLLGCQNSKNLIVINGEITGELPDKVKYTSPVNGVCNWSFIESVQPDSLGRFQIIVESEKPIFIKLRTSYEVQSTLIAEPGKTYDVRFDFNKKENIFSVIDESSGLQETYNRLPNPVHIQDGAREFLRDSVAVNIKETIEQRRTAEIAEFENLLSDKVIAQKVFDLVKTDRDCYYDAVLATIAWINKMRSMQMGNEFTNDFEILWNESFKQPLFSRPQILNSQWFNFYAECYINFQEYKNGEYTNEKMEEIRVANQIMIYPFEKAKEFLPAEVCENYLAYYLYNESLQKEYQKELIGLFDDFKANYPNSKYIQYVSSFIDEIIEFHKVAEAEFDEKINFVENYQNLNLLSEITNTFEKGNIYVDVWASWCGPCKAEFEHKEVLKELLQKNDIQLLYISIDRDRDSLQWKNMIKFYNLEGNHVRANNELTAELRELYGMDGSLFIPWYILTDKNGNILKKHASSPSQVKELEKEINNL